jgi:hypothetical protein
MGKPRIGRDMDMGNAGEGSGDVGAMLGKTTWVSLITGPEEWVRNMNLQRLRCQTSESVTAPVHWRR